MYKKLSQKDEIRGRDEVKKELMDNPEKLWNLSLLGNFHEFVSESIEKKLIADQFGMDRESLSERLSPYIEEIHTRLRTAGISRFFQAEDRIKHWNIVADILNEEEFFWES